MWLGLDIGTSAVKAVVVDLDGKVVADAAARLPISRPRPAWSEQHPDDWWQAATSAVKRLPSDARAVVRAVGLAGQMHGAVLLDDADRALRPAILWNDGRSAIECHELELREPRTREITANAAMPGFTAPKLLWVRKHEPGIFNATAKVLLPKDYVRLRMTGDHASDMSDSSGTLWLDPSARRWSSVMLAACHLDEGQMPRLYEGSEPTGVLRAEVAAEWGMERVPVAAGGGDNSAGAIGSGVVAAGQAFLSVGTSGVLFVATDRLLPAPDRGAHAFCHALPGRWHQMAVMLSAASALDWAVSFAGYRDVGTALAAVHEKTPFARPEVFLPYLSGERTPHNDADARGALVGLDHDSGPGDLIMAVLEGVAYGFADGLAVLEAAGTPVLDITVIGGASQSRLWGRVLAAALQRPLHYRSEAHLGPAYGAARLARLSEGHEAAEVVCSMPPISHVVEPEKALVDDASSKLQRFRALYPALKGKFR